MAMPSNFKSPLPIDRNLSTYQKESVFASLPLLDGTLFHYNSSSLALLFVFSLSFARLEWKGQRDFARKQRFGRCWALTQCGEDFAPTRTFLLLGLDTKPPHHKTAFGLNISNNPWQFPQNDVEMLDTATSDAEEANFVQLLLTVPTEPRAQQPLTDSQNSQISLSRSASPSREPLPPQWPSFQHASPIHPALALNNVPIMFPRSVEGPRLDSSVRAPVPLNLVPVTRGNIQRSRSRSRSPRLPGSLSPGPVEGVGEAERHLESATSKIWLVGIDDPQKDALIASLSEQLLKSNSLLQDFERQLREVKADTAALQSKTQSAEDLAKKAEKELADQKLRSDDRLRALEKTLQDDASQKIVLAEKRAQSMLLDLKGLRYPLHSIGVQQELARSEDAMVLDRPDAEKGKQRAGQAPHTQPPGLLPPALPAFPRPLPPPKHPHSKARPTPSSSAAGGSDIESLKNAQSLPKPLNIGRPKSQGEIVNSSDDASDSEDINSSDAEDEDNEPRPPWPPSNISGLDTEELLKLLLTTLGVNTTNFGFGPRHRNGHSEFKDPVKRRTNDKEKTKLMNWLRQHLHHLMGIKKTRDILKFKDDIFARDTELQRSMALWEKDKTGEGPIIEPMKVNWNNLEGPWNSRLCELFVQYCVEKGLGDGNPSEGVAEFVVDYFWGRLQHMRMVVRKNRPKMEEDPETHSARVNGRHLEALVTARRNTRRNQIFKDRIDICLDNLPRTADEITTNEQQIWKIRHDIVQALGPEGMSSDESDTEASSKTCTIKKLPWRNKRLIGTMKSIDKSRNTTNAYGNTRPGNSPRIRVRKDKPKNSARKRVPTGKPVDLYEPDWYEKLKYQKKLALHAKPAIHY